MNALAVSILTAALFAANASAQTTPPLAGKPGMGMMDINARMTKMHEHMKNMQTMMERIHKTTDPAERRKLMQEHMQSMRDGMGMMQGMGGGMMMGGKGGMGPGMMGGDPKQRQEMMERRMDMMQMMMDQMMQHQHMSSPPAK